MKLKDPNLLISLLALVISLATLGYTIAHDRAEQREDIAVGVQEVLGNYQTLVQRGIGPAQPARVAVAWEGLIANNGSVPVTIVGYELRQLTPAEVYYTGLDMGVTDVAGKRLDFPISVDPGKAVAFRIRTGVLVDSQTYNQIANQYPIGSSPRFGTLVKSLAQLGIDLYGNQVEYRELTPGSGTITGPPLDDPATVRPSYLLALRTTRRTVVRDVFSVYDLLGRW